MWSAPSRACAQTSDARGDRVRRSRAATILWDERQSLRHDLCAMTFAEFERSLKTDRPPRGLAPALAALWWAKKDGWDKAHPIVMNEAGRDAARGHASL